jgi:hypothetical protein
VPRGSISTSCLTLALALITACGGNDSTGSTQVELGTYVRLADPSFESIEACEEAKLAEGDGVLFNCSQILTLNEDGTFFRVLTDIAETGSYTTDDSSLVLTSDADESTSKIPINEDGTLGDGWQLDPEAPPGEG